MPDRWTRWCRRVVPPALREVAFDPALADLELEWATAARREPAALIRLIRILQLAWQCRRLHDAERRRAYTSPARRREGRLIRLSDVRLAARRLARQPLFTATAALTLAFGVGANLAAAAFVHAFLLSPVNAPEPERLVRVVQATPAGETTEIVSWPNYLDARNLASGVDLAAHAPASAVVGRADEADVRSVELVSGNYFRVLGQAPTIGRLIDDNDNVAELAGPVVVLSESYWHARFGASPGVIGQMLIVNGTPLEIVGVAASGFRGTYRAHAVDLWAPVMMQQVVRPRGLTIDRRTWGWLRMVGLRRPGVSLETLQAQLDAAAADVNRRFPPRLEADAFGLLASPAAAISTGDRALLVPVLATTLVFTLLVFGVTAANLAGVMQARMLARRRELAIRQSLGAGRGRLVWEWLTECLLLATAGGALGVLSARGFVALAGRFQLPPQLAGDLSLAVDFDWRLSVYAVGLSLAAVVVFGLIPARAAGRGAPVAWLRSEGSGMTGSRTARGLRRTAVVVQLALSGVLLFGAALLGRSLVNQQRFDVGFETGHLGLLSLNLERQRIPEDQWRSIADQVLERVRRDPDVRQADLGFRAPLEFGNDVMGFRIPGQAPQDGRDYFSIDFNVVGSRYFDALGAPFVSGGTWPPHMADGAEPVAVINETMARAYWGDRDPVGELIEIVGVADARVSGVVRDVAYYDIGGPAIPYVYLPAELRMPGRFVLQVRTTRDPDAVMGRLARAIDALDSRLVPYDVMSFEKLRSVPLFPVRLLTTTAAVFSVLAVVLAGIGLYGVVAMSVGARTREIGVRMALGARPDAVLRGVLAESLALAATGLAVAVVGGYLAAGVFGAWLVGVSRLDAAVIAGVTVLLVVLALVAAWVPARRAARIDPVAALRQ